MEEEEASLFLSGPVFFLLSWHGRWLSCKGAWESRRCTASSDFYRYPMSSTGRFLAASPALWHLRKLLLHPVGYRCTDTSSPTGGLSHGRALLPCLFLPWAPSLSPRGRGCTLHLLFLYYEEFSFPLLEVNRLLLVNNFTLNFPSPNNQCGFCFLTGP